MPAEQPTTVSARPDRWLFPCALAALVGNLLFLRWQIGSWEGVLWLAVGILVPACVIFRVVGDGFET